MKRYGATPDEWAAFKRLAKVDLLPVVSSPNAEISPHSKMKGVGKTPSLYNGARQAKGFTEWTDHEATVRNIEAWSAEEDYGVCIQTRTLRGFDIDVSDPTRADEIEARFLELLGLDSAPARCRSNSGKRLLVVRAEGVLDRQSFAESAQLDPSTGKTKRELVELLGNGQQFIAAGQHTSGVRYEWRDGLPTPSQVPTVDIEDLREAWDVLEAEFGIPGSGRRVGRRDPTLLEDLDTTDPVAEWLVQSDWPTYSCERGMLYVECPGADGHSTDNGETQTAWLLAGSGQYRNGHFRCMHAGCGEITDDKFFQAVGYKVRAVEEFDDLSGEVLAEAVETYAKAVAAKGGVATSKGLAAAARGAMPLPGFERDPQGRILTTLENITKALRNAKAADCDIAHDEFRGELMMADAPGEWRPLKDADTVRLRIRLEALGFKDRIGKEMMRDALELVGDEQRFDSAVEWLTEVVPEWDGVSRIAHFLPRYMATEDSAYTRAVGVYAWTAQAGRVLSAGVKADMVPVLVGAQGARKSSGIAAIAPHEDFFSEFDLEAKDEDKARKMRGCLVGELAELRGLQTRDRESILAWITRRFEKWTPKYKEYEVSVARRCLFWGTTNDDEFLSDPTGERRWLPALVLGKVDVDAITRDREQLWAEAREVYLHDGGVAYADAERLARAEHDKFKVTDPWLARVAAWLDAEDDIGDGGTPRTSGNLLADDVLVECLGLQAAKITKKDQMRVGAVLKKCGMEKVQKRVTTSKKQVVTRHDTAARVWVNCA